MRNLGEKLSISNKLHLTIIGSLCITGFICMMLMIAYSSSVNKLVLESLEKEVSTVAEIISVHSKATLEFEDSNVAKELLSTLDAGANIISAHIYKQSGDLFTEQIFQPAFNKSFALIDSYIVIKNPIKVDEIDIGWVEIHASNKEFLEIMRKYFFRIIAILVSILALSILISLRFQEFITKPIKNLISAIETVRSHFDYGIRIEGRNNSELGKLTDSFNEMLQAIQLRDSGLESEVQKKNQELKMVNLELYELLTKESLTDLNNRNSFNDWINEISADAAQNSETSFALLFIDIDHFKYTNDMYGHHIGDLFITQMGERLAQLQNKNNLMFRFGGDEFIIILLGMSETDTVKREASKIRESLTDSSYMIFDNNYGKIEITFTISMGISIMPLHGKNVDDIVKNADIALYEAKKRGRDQALIYNSEIKEAINSKFTLLQDFKDALCNDAFIIYLQGIYQANTGELKGFEILSRWKHNGTFISPEVFISCAEENNLITEYNYYLFKKACQLIESSHSKNSNLSYSINFSVYDINNSNFVSKIISIVGNYNFPINLLNFEICESILLSDTPTVIENITRLRNLGIKIYIDDFGTGYSSLSYLNSFSIDAIKIDKQFIKGISHSEESRRLIQVIISLKNIYGFAIIAEGVETLDQLNILRSENCDFIQGYYFHKPQYASDAIEEIVSSDRKQTKNIITHLTP